MDDIKELIEDYLNSWKECSYCEHMVKIELLYSDNHDNNICKECIDIEYGEA